jgi:hypothetical protein
MGWNFSNFMSGCVVYMPTIVGSHVFPPKSWDEFEDITLSAVKLRWGSPDFFRNGRPGQSQDGIDIFGQTSDFSKIGIQCKNTIGGVSEDVILAEIKKAESFNPPIEVLYIATTSNRDVKIQEKVRIISEQRIADGKFSVYMLFWDEVVFDLAKDKSEFFKHYPDFSPAPSEQVVVPANGCVTFSIEEMKVERHAIFSGKKISRMALAKTGGWITFFGIAALSLTFLPLFHGSFSNWVPVAMLLFGTGMMLLLTSVALKRNRFECIFMRKYYIELSENDNLQVNRLTATCPWCGSNMNLRHFGIRAEPRSDIFVCERNSRQHTIVLDPTLLPEIRN